MLTQYKLIKDEQIEKKLINAKRIAVLTGAGISAESGIPIFRGENGLWTKLSPDELASFDAFYNNTAIVSEWYKHRREIIEKAEPNPGHYALVELSKIPTIFDLITQNIDALHQRAGSENVIELHGNIMENYCIDCGKVYNSDEFDKIFNNSPDHIPRCECGGLIRPNVVWFGEQLPQENLERAYYAAVNADVFFSIGTSAEVTPAANLPRYAKLHGVLLIEINPNRTAISEQVDLCLQGKSGEILPKFVEEYKQLIKN
jgi:NAD-dependent deacetylase